MNVYFDHNATTPIDERVLEAMYPYLKELYGNPSSVHRDGKQARMAIDLAREQIAALVNAHPTQVIFTSGGTEANNLAIKGYAANAEKGAIAISAIEHSSVLEAAKSVARQGWTLNTIGADGAGNINKESVREAINDLTRFVSVMYVNNETGVIQNIAELSEVAREHGVVFHTDAVQAIGKMAVDFPSSGVQLMSMSAHKLYGPKGIGALVLDKSLDIEPLLHGGGHEKGLRAGTENVPAIVGFGKAAEIARLEWRGRAQTISQLKDYLEEKLLQIPGLTIIAMNAKRVDNTVFFSVKGVDGETLVMNLDAAGFSIASGSACESQSMDPSHVLLAMGYDRDLARSAIRVSLGKDNTRKQVEDFITALKQQLGLLQDLAVGMMA
jgi:cysteine desulfurase